MLPFVLVWAFYFFLVWNFKNSKFLIIISGLFYGLGFHTYIAWRLSPLLIIFIFLILLIKKDYDKKICFKIFSLVFYSWFYCNGTTRYILLKQYTRFFGRASDVSIFKSASPVKAFAESAIKTLGMFNVYGDANWRHNLSGRPELFWPFGISFIIGLAIVIKHF